MRLLCLRPSLLEDIYDRLFRNEDKPWNRISKKISSNSNSRSDNIKFKLEMRRQYILSQKSTEGYSYSKIRLEDNANYIKEIIDSNGKVNNISERREEPEWLFPKGRLQHKRESGIDCAYREFREEAGFYPVGTLLLSPVRERIVGLTGCIYETCCWICLINKEEILTDPKGNIEIKRRLWVTTEEASHLLSGDKYRMLEQAIRLIS